MPVVTVSGYVLRLQQALEQLPQDLWLQGEVSNFTAASSGHWYFNLKDSQAQLRCVMFRSRNQRLEWTPRNGMALELRGPATFYGPGGTLQITVESMRQTGQGRLYEAFLRLKQQLESEGLFATPRKRPLPPYPRAIGVVTSPAAAALRDVLTTLARRAPAIPVILYPAPVQGEGAAALLAQALDRASQRAECEVVLLCRGGGSIEDLWAFNEEILARAIARSTLPVVSGVGHETDFTIADFVADHRAATPTAAAESVTPDRQTQLEQLQQLRLRWERTVQRTLQSEAQRLDSYLPRWQRAQWRNLQREQQRLDGYLPRWQRAAQQTLLQAHQRWREAQGRLRHPQERLRGQREQLNALWLRWERCGQHQLERLRLRLHHQAAALTHLNPRAVLERGFSIVSDQQGRILRHSTDTRLGVPLRITLATGSLEAQVAKIDPPGSE